jgi:hypothetical protein
MNQPHAAQVLPSWYGDSVGHYEGDTLVIDTVGIKIGVAMIDWYGTPHTQALHVVERYRLIDYEAAKEAQERALRKILAVLATPGWLSTPMLQLLKSPCFCLRSHAENCHVLHVLPLGDEFREGIAFCRTHEKFGKCLAQRFCHDKLRWRDVGTNGGVARCRPAAPKVRQAAAEARQCLLELASKRLDVVGRILQGAFSLTSRLKVLSPISAA